ncbi:cytidine deaminase [Flavobacteriaceae bacterium]|nr:cytidine deaminase [Flavobacteriaceae bacterium]
MPVQTHTFEYSLFDTLEELSPSFQSLMQEAILARANAYAPYSNFNVGAAVLLDNGVIVRGNNQENAAYPSGLCAERVAIFYASAQYPDIPIKAIAVTANTHLDPSETPASPCGNCRQTLAEYQQKQATSIPIIFMGASGKIVCCNSVLDLLPFAFSAKFLK